MKTYRDLIVWQKSIDLTVKVYQLTAQFPKDEQYGLISQIRRCAISIPSNIAEGSKRKSKKEFLQFLHIASGSAAELETQLLLIKNIYSIADPEVSSVLSEIHRMLESLIRKL
jgi:four helix bundle protein